MVIQLRIRPHTTCRPVRRGGSLHAAYTRCTVWDCTRNLRRIKRKIHKRPKLFRPSGPGNPAAGSGRAPHPAPAVPVRTLKAQSGPGASVLTLVRRSLRPDQFVEPVEGGCLVAFGQCRVIQHGVDEILHPAFENHHRLSDVEQFGGALADDVDAQEFLRLPVEEQLQPAGGVASNGPARDLAVVGDADLVGLGSDDNPKRVSRRPQAGFSWVYSAISAAGPAEAKR